jgi:uncharacterized protein
MRTLDIIDADGHITEPVDLWDRYIDPKYRDTCPKISILDDGAEHFRIDDKLWMSGKIVQKKPSIATACLFGARDGLVASDLHYFEGEKGGFDPHARINWMDKEGFDGAMLYPTMAPIAIHLVTDPDRQIAIANAYNRYLADFVKPYKDRLFGAAILPMLSIEGTLKEIKAAKKMGFNAAVVRPNPTGGRSLHDPDFYPIWKACEDMDLAIAVHGGAGGDNLGMDRFNANQLPIVGANFPTVNKSKSFSMEHCFIHTAEMMAAVTSFIMGRVCEKFPKLRVAFVEGGAGWLPGYIDRMDRHFDDIGMNDTELTVRPSELFRRQCFITFEPIETSISVLAEFFGGNKFMAASDYPHSDGFPETLKLIKQLNLAQEVERQVLSVGFKEWYGLTKLAA